MFSSTPECTLIISWMIQINSAIWKSSSFCHYWRQMLVWLKALKFGRKA
jgi:hypothetical protein